MLYIFDRHEVLLEIITDYSEFDFKDKLQTSSIFSFSTSKKNNIKKGNKVGFFRKEKFQLFLIDDFTEHTYIDESQISVVTISDYNILGNSIIEDKRVINGTLREAAEKALEGSEYKVGVVEEFENKNINFYFVSRLKALNDIVNTFNCEIDVRIEIDDSTGKIINKYIDFKHRLGKDTGLRFTFDTNLEVIEKSPIGDHFNVLYGRGKSLETDSGGYSRKLDFAEVNNGKKYVEDLESIKKYGRLEGIYENNNIDDKELLLSKTLEKLEETKNPKFIYKVSLRNLIAFDKFEHYQCEKGDTIFILDEEDDLVLEARVVEISEEDNEVILTLSNIETGLMDEDIESEIGNIKDKIDIIENKKPTIDTIYPDTLPDVPILTAKALYASVILDWTYSNKDYYTYELFASQIKNFNPTSDNRIFEGKASSFLHEVNPSQTWYYRARAKNTYGNTTLFSNQIEVTTRKISDSAEIFEEAAIGHAIIKDLDMDKATVGKLKGQRIDARNLTVTDGNRKRTLDIDSYGNVYLDVNSFKIRSEKVNTEFEVIEKIQNAVRNYSKQVDNKFEEANSNLGALEGYIEGAFHDGIINASEAKSLRGLLDVIKQDKAVIDKEYNTLYSNNYLMYNFKQLLYNTKNTYNSAFSNYESKLTLIINKGSVTDVEQREINNLGNSYREAIKNYKDVVIQCLDSISSKRVEELSSTVTDKLVKIETSNGEIKNTVKGITSDIANINGEVKKRLTKEEFTEFKQTENSFKLTIEERINLRNIVPNGKFEGGTLHWWGEPTEEWFYWDVYKNYDSYGFNGRNVLSLKNVHYYNNEKRAYSAKCYPVEQNTDYTLNFHYCVEQNIQECRVYVIMSNTEEGTYERVYTALIAQGGQQSDTRKDIPHTFKFNTGQYKYVWLSFNNLGMKPGSNWQEYHWFNIADVAIYKGDVGPVKFIPNSKELYSNKVTIDKDNFRLTFENGNYAQLGRLGIEQKIGSMEYPYHCLGWAKAVGIPVGNPGKVNVRLPDEFDHCQKESINWSVAQRGYYYNTSGAFFPFYVQVQGERIFKHTDGHWYVEIHGYARIQSATNQGDVQNMPGGVNAMLTVNA
ncbi:phage tail protein [Clostridium perfringens]|nr:phage tail protein [Clostridium perfringens]